MLSDIPILFINRIGLPFLKKGKKPGKEVEALFNVYKSEIRNVYKQPLYWHGTGRFQYISGSGKVEDILKKIIKNNGLVPKRKGSDIKNGSTDKMKLSLAKIRMYASIFAQTHQYKNDKVSFLFGTRFFWLCIIIFNNFIHHPLRIIYQTFRYSFSQGREQMILFESRVSKREELRKLKIFILQYLSLPAIYSDIEGNYPILIAIKKRGHRKFNHSFDMYELRTEEQILFKDISHIEVPNSALNKTRKLFEKFHKNIQILPLEVAEFYLYKQFTLKELLAPVKNEY